MYWVGAGLLGLTVGMDPFIHGRKWAVLTHPLASVITAVVVRTQTAPVQGGFTVANVLLALLATLALACLWAERNRDESTGLVLISIALVFGVSCGTGDWAIAALTWTVMLSLHIRRISLPTEPAKAGLAGEHSAPDQMAAPLEPLEWPTDLRWVRELGRAPRPQPGLLVRFGLLSNGYGRNLRLQ